MAQRRLLRPSRAAGLVLLTLLVTATISQTVLAQSRVATSAASFLTLGMGARGSALGHAYTASATGADALLWNPAGAALRGPGGQRGSVFFSHADWIVDTDLNAFGLVIPVMGSGAFGISLAQLDYGRMDVRTVNLPDGTGETFGASDLVIGLTYAQPLTDRFFIGGTGKWIRQNIYDMSASTMAFDIGFVLVSDYFNGLRIAASIMNFGGLMRMEGVNGRVFVDIDPTHSGSNEALPATLETTAWSLPLSFKFGTALPVVQTSAFTLELLADAHQTNDNELNVDLGTEARYDAGPVALDLRLGYKDAALGDQVQNHWAVGGGLSTSIGRTSFGADFGYIPFDVLGNVSVLDFRIGF
ncbi:MAG: PorV/PorQ family protein [Rhodothermales bacterium]|nr:PorV/PorQ family protein [Rhodothermales bacterium]